MMKGLEYTGVVFLILIALFISECKNHEKVSSPSPEDSRTNSCTEIEQNLSGDSLYFVAQAESKREKIASQKAKKETVIKLVQFFQTEFIEGGQLNIFSSSERLANWNSATSESNSALRKKWSEVSFEMIGSMHNRESFTHKQDISKDDRGSFTAMDVLIIPKEWVRDHWKKSLAATDSSLYLRAKESMMYEQLVEMDIKQEQLCQQFKISS